MATFIDTSGFYAHACTDDSHHDSVADVLSRLAEQRERLVSTSYVLSETMGLIQRRLGFSVLKSFMEDVLGVVEIVWIGPAEQAAGWELMKSKPSRGLTIVDATGIVVMRRQAIRRCVALDPAFTREGFEMLPTSS